MNCKQAKEIKIISYLNSLGIKPESIKNHNYWYKSMIRNHELKASFKVDTIQNCWYDHGLGQGGNILDLVMLMFNISSISEALNILDKKIYPFSFHKQKVTKKGIEQPRIKYVKKLTNKLLLEYTKNERLINNALIRRYCYEVYYTADNNSYFAIGFKNNLGGYELRNKYWKGCIGKKSVTLINNNSSTCYVFEGFMDFLSFIQLFPNKERQHDFLILNSTSNVKDGIDITQNYKSVKTFLDNDKSGQLTSQIIQQNISSYTNCSHYFLPHKDINEYLQNIKG